MAVKKKAKKRAVKKLFEFTVDRSKWFRGLGPSESKLRNEDGYQCCLGFLARAAGVPTVSIVEQATVVDLLPHYGTSAEDMPASLRFLVKAAKTTGGYDYVTSSRAAGALMNANDAMRSPSRERRLKTLFLKHGIRVKFVGRTNKKATEYLANMRESIKQRNC